MADTPKSTDPSKSPQATSPESLNRPTPGFGWTAYAEQLNGRFAMIGIVALILIEVLTGHGFISWLGF